MMGQVVFDPLLPWPVLWAGAALAAAVVGDQGGALQLAMGLLGGTLAAGTHLAKAGARAAINTSPEPVSNVAQARALLAKSNKRVALLVQRDDVRLFVPVDLG